MWDFSLVDPDNRRPVDYAGRRASLGDLRERLARGKRRELAAELVRDWRDGRIKLYLIQQTLALRHRLPDLFLKGDYRPLRVTGEKAEHAFGFLRRSGRHAIVVVVPRLPWILSRGGRPLNDADAWNGTGIVGLEGMVSGSGLNLFTGAKVPRSAGREGMLPVGTVFADFPVALLEYTMKEPN
jgi:(1->4)-alpha-D-glucan 1-alpha-D-glucosylmutase